jgi:type VI secretion system protein ImpA
MLRPIRRVVHRSTSGRRVDPKPIGVDFVAQLSKLEEPIAVGNACGSALDDTQALAALEAYRVFGRIKAAGDEPDWRAIRAASLDALADSKDLRVLAHLAAATLRSDALPDALRVILLVDTWLARYWAEVYPRLDDDAIARRNALMFFADRLGIVDPLRRTAVVKDARLGSFSVRDFEIANGLLAATDPDAKPTSNDLIKSALSAADPRALTDLSELALAAGSALQRIESVMLERGGGSNAVPKLDALLQVLQRMQQMLAPYVLQPAEPAASNLGESSSVGSNGTVPKAQEVGTIACRQDVLRALDAVMSYYRSNEPGSLVPMLAERAKRLVSMSFFEALAEVAPEVVDPVKKAVGVRDPSV